MRGLVVILERLLVVKDVIAEAAEEGEHGLLPRLVAVLDSVGVRLQSRPHELEALEASEGPILVAVVHPVTYEVLVKVLEVRETPGTVLALVGEAPVAHVLFEGRKVKVIPETSGSLLNQAR